MTAREQLERAGYMPRVRYWVEHEAGGRVTLTGQMDPAVVEELAGDPRFAQGALYGLHRDVGERLTDFRSYNGAFGRGSLQVVVDRHNGAFYADVDRHNPYQDVARFLGHAFGEVVPNWARRVWRRVAKRG